MNKQVCFFIISLMSFSFPALQGMEPFFGRSFGRFYSFTYSEFPISWDHPARPLVTPEQQRLNNILFRAVEDNNLDVVKQCILDGADVNALNDLYWKPLHRAAKQGLFEIAQYLISQKAEIDPRDNHERTPLYWAAEGGYCRIAKLLLEHGANPNAQNSNSETPLHTAAYGSVLDVITPNKYLETIHWLLSYGADINQTDKNNETPSDQAARRPDSPNALIFKCLLGQGAHFETAYKKSISYNYFYQALYAHLKPLLENIKDWQQIENKALTLVDPEHAHHEAKEICFNILLNTADTKNLLALIRAVKEFNIQDGFFGTLFSKLTESESKKLLLTQHVQFPARLELFFKAGWNEELNEKEVKSLQETIKVAQPKGCEHLYAFINDHLNWNLKRNLGLQSKKQKPDFEDVIILRF